MRVASCEPPPHAPSAAEFTPPPPENLLLNISTVDSFPDARRFSLDQVIGCGDLYIVFLEFLRKVNVRTDRLYCIRKIDIYVELMTMQCEKEATEQAWHIYRYYIMQYAVCEVIIHELERKRVMFSLAELKKDLFEHSRGIAYGLLKEDFKSFTETKEYTDLAMNLREKKLNNLNRKKSTVIPITPTEKKQSVSLKSPPQNKLISEVPVPLIAVPRKKSSSGNLFPSLSPGAVSSKGILSGISGVLQSVRATDKVDFQ
jgi:hypothetical protein